MTNSHLVFGMIMFFMAVILCSYRKETEMTAFFHSMLKISVIFLLLLGLGYLNFHSLKMKHTFADKMEEEKADDGYDRIGNVYGQIYKIDKKDHSIMVWMHASKVVVDTVMADQYYTGNMKLIAYLPKTSDVKPGQTVTLSGELKRPAVASNPGAFDARSYYENQGVFFILYSAKILEQSESYNKISAGLLGLKEKVETLFDEIFDPDCASVVCAMLLGEKGRMDEELKSLYQMSGMSHILAISGVHIAILGIGLYQLLRKVFGSFYLCGSVTLCVILLYGIMTGMSASTVRAIIMICIFLLGQALGRSIDLLTSMGTACIVMMIFNPLIIIDAGFQLSFMAIVGLGMILPVLTKVFGKKGKVQQALLAGISVNLALTPIIIYYYFEVPLYSVVLNLIVVPLVSVIIFCSLLTGIVGMLSISVAKFCAFPVVVILRLYDLLGSVCTRLPYHSIHVGHISVSMIVVYYAGVAFVLWMLICIKAKRNRIYSMCLLIMTLFVVGTYEYQHLDRGFQVVFLDVGQGDGILIRTESGINIMIDGGSSDKEQIGKYVLTPALKYYAMSEVDYVLVSHGDKDHISGLLEILQTEYSGIVIKNMVLPLYGEQEAFEELIDTAKRKNVNILYADAGLSMDMGDSRLTCLYPDEDVQLMETNALSGVWKLTTKDLSILFAGDLDVAGEEYILGENIDVSCDVLKVGHHGSKYSSSAEFLEACQMKQAVISCGKKNAYGHPHPETMKRLEYDGCTIIQTQENGAVMLRIEDGEMSVEGFLD